MAVVTVSSAAAESTDAAEVTQRVPPPLGPPAPAAGLGFGHVVNTRSPHLTWAGNAHIFPKTAAAASAA